MPARVEHAPVDAAGFERRDTLASLAASEVLWRSFPDANFYFLPTRAWQLGLSLLPMTDDRFRTLVVLADTGEEVSFQDYFVRLRHSVPVAGVRFEHTGAALTDDARRALAEAAAVVIAPSNPVVSIGPIRALPGVDDLLATRRDTVVAVSPIVAGSASISARTSPGERPSQYVLR